MDLEQYRAAMKERMAAWERFNEWERRQPPARLSPEVALRCVGDLYDLLPPEARDRECDPSGIMEMHRMLAALGESRSSGKTATEEET